VQVDNKGKRCVLPGGARQTHVLPMKVHKGWLPPEAGTLKIHVDGAFFPESGRAAVGVIIRDHEGHTKLSAWRLLVHCRDAEEGEVAACREGIVMAARWPDLPMVIETDCAAVVERLKSKEQDRSVTWSLIHEARLATEDLCSLDVVKIRSQNNVAHELAHFAIRSGRSQVFFSSFPEFVLSLVCNDTMRLLMKFLFAKKNQGVVEVE